MGRKLATGGFGTVFRGEMRMEDGEMVPVIVKKVSVRTTSGSSLHTQGIGALHARSKPHTSLCPKLCWRESLSALVHIVWTMCCCFPVSRRNASLNAVSQQAKEFGQAEAWMNERLMRLGGKHAAEFITAFDETLTQRVPAAGAPCRCWDGALPFATVSVGSVQTFMIVIVVVIC